MDLNFIRGNKCVDNELVQRFKHINHRLGISVNKNIFVFIKSLALNRERIKIIL